MADHPANNHWDARLTTAQQGGFRESLVIVLVPGSGRVENMERLKGKPFNQKNKLGKKGVNTIKRM